jgi:hypothetical protein
MHMEWRNLLFVHWRVPAERLRALVPAELSIDELGGSAWVGLVPFTMRAVLPSVMPPVPGLADIPAVTAFHECNVRTYVSRNGVPGVWFFSLDAASPAGVWVGRQLFHLRYFHASISVSTDGDLTRYDLKRNEPPRGGMHCAWRAGQPLPAAQPGELAHFLTERYLLYSMDRFGHLHQCQISHDPWPLRQATLVALDESLTAADGIVLDGEQPEPVMLHYADELHVRAWLPQRVR